MKTKELEKKEFYTAISKNELTNRLCKTIFMYRGNSDRENYIHAYIRMTVIYDDKNREDSISLREHYVSSLGKSKESFKFDSESEIRKSTIDELLLLQRNSPYDMLKYQLQIRDIELKCRFYHDFIDIQDNYQKAKEIIIYNN